MFYKSDTKRSWCLFKKGKHDAFQLAEVNYIYKDEISVTAHWFGEHTHSIHTDCVFVFGDRQKLQELLNTYNSFKSYQERRFNKTLMLL